MQFCSNMWFNHEQYLKNHKKHAQNIYFAKNYIIPRMEIRKVFPCGDRT